MRDFSISYFKSRWVKHRSAFLKIFLAIACWSFIGILFAAQWYVQLTNAGRDITWLTTLTWAMNTWGTWAILSPAIFWLANKFKIERETFWRNASIHLIASVIFSIVQFTLQTGAEQFTTWTNEGDISFAASFNHVISKSFHLNLLTYWAVVGISHGIEYYRKSQEREKKAAQLESQLAKAQLRALKMQLHPHFLFNTLNMISELIFIEPESAERMIARLGEFLRVTLENDFTDEITLKQEIFFLNKYLEIEQARFGSRLEVRMEIMPESANALVPALILQPLVENAIKHGITNYPEGGWIEINAKRKNGNLCLQVKDSGQSSGLEFPNHFTEGIGLANTKARLKQLYDENYQFKLYNPVEDGGACASLEFPYRTLPKDGKR